MYHDSCVTEYREAFQLFDKDKDGTISAAEIKTVMLSLGRHASECDVDDMVREVDGDGTCAYGTPVNVTHQGARRSTCKNV